MKRAIVGDFQRYGTVMLAGVWLTAAAACSAPTRQTTRASVGASAWVTTPMIQSAERTNGGLTLRGTVSPGGRVVVRGAAGVAYATGADDQGRFILRIASPATDALFVVETQNGQDAAPAPYRLLVTRDVGGPIALLTPGGASRRLDRAGPLDVVDGDGQALLVSGRATPGAVVPVAMGGGVPVAIPAGPDGRWVDQLEGGATGITVGERVYERPVPPPSAIQGALSVIVAPGGRLVRWATPGGAVQQSWFPDAG